MRHFVVYSLTMIILTVYDEWPSSCSVAVYTQIASDVGLTSARKSGRHRPNIVLTSSPTSATLGWRQDNVWPTSAQPSANVGATLAQPLGNVGPTFFANNVKTFWATFCQCLADLLPTFACWYFHVVYLKLYLIFDVLKMSRKCHIWRHILVRALMHDISMTSLRHQGNMCYKSDSDFVGHFLLLIYLYTCRGGIPCNRAEWKLCQTGHL